MQEASEIKQTKKLNSEDDNFIQFLNGFESKAISDMIPALKRGYVTVHVWLGNKYNDSVGHVSLEATRYNMTTDKIETSYLGYWPESEDDLEPKKYGNSYIKFVWNMFKGIQGRFVNQGIEAIGEAGHSITWDMDHDYFKKEYGSLPTYSVSLATLDIDKIFSKTAEIKNPHTDYSPTDYSPFASSIFGYKTNNCITIVEQALVAGGFNNLLFKKYDWLSPLFALVSTLFCSRNSTSRSKVVKLLLFFYLLGRALVGASKGYQEGSISTRNHYIKNMFRHSGTIIKGASLSYGVFSYLFNPSLTRKEVYLIKTPENFLELLKLAQEAEYKKYPILKQYNDKYEKVIAPYGFTRKNGEHVNILSGLSYRNFLLKEIKKEKSVTDVEIDRLTDAATGDYYQKYERQRSIFLMTQSEKLKTKLKEPDVQNKEFIQKRLEQIEEEIDNFSSAAKL